MSRSRCPYCKGQLSIKTILKKADWSEKPMKRHLGHKRKFDHGAARLMFKQGKSVAAIAEFFGVSKVRVYQIINKL